MPNQNLWHIMTTLDRAYDFFLEETVVALAGSNLRLTAKHYIEFLVSEGVLRKKSDRYQIDRHGFAPPLRRSASPVKSREQQAMWTALRSCGPIKAAELALMASTEERIISLGAAKLYLGRLRVLRILHCDPDSQAFRLLPGKNTGPRAPIVEGEAFDINLMRPVNVTAQPSVKHDRRAA